MSSTRLLTSNDLDRYGRMVFQTDDLLGLAAELVDAIDQGRLADPEEDTGYALLVASEIADRGGDLASAAALAGRAVEAYRTYGKSDDDYPRAVHGEMLLRLGREDEAMAEFTVLRPKLTEDDYAVSCICEAFESGGRPDIAEQWLTEALHTVVQRQQELESEPRNPYYRQAASMVVTLARRRHRLRRELDLPHDEDDRFSDHLLDEICPMAESLWLSDEK